MPSSISLSLVVFSITFSLNFVFTFDVQIRVRGVYAKKRTTEKMVSQFEKCVCVSELWFTKIIDNNSNSNIKTRIYYYRCHKLNYSNKKKVSLNWLGEVPKAELRLSAIKIDLMFIVWTDVHTLLLFTHWILSRTHFSLALLLSALLTHYLALNCIHGICTWHFLYYDMFTHYQVFSHPTLILTHTHTHFKGIIGVKPHFHRRQIYIYIWYIYL